uniref:Expressed protein n=1 Tax=Oryza sativa subsp. japonica TaxID=39947 RepID=Q10HH5_ORYSJ|nr:expressed protein [Oryza sativa Japonica Group]
MADRGSRGEVYREEKEIALCNCKEILQLAKDDEIKLGGRWKSLDTVLLVRYKRSTGEYPSTM